MPIIPFSAEDSRDPLKSAVTVVHIENAEDCYGELCGQQYEENGKALKPRAHSHVIITGHDPETTPRAVPISK